MLHILVSVHHLALSMLLNVFDAVDFDSFDDFDGFDNVDNFVQSSFRFRGSLESFLHSC